MATQSPLSDGSSTTIHEVRLVLPMAMEEYRVGRLYCLLHQPESSTNYQAQLKIMRRYDSQEGAWPLNGVYTLKHRDVPEGMLELIEHLIENPAKEQQVTEELWANFPLARSKYTFGSGFSLTTDTRHVEGDKGDLENALNLSTTELATRVVMKFDMRPEKQWKPLDTNVMSIYKVVRTKAGWMNNFVGLDSFFVDAEITAIKKFHQDICSTENYWQKFTLDTVIEHIEMTTSFAKTKKNMIKSDLAALDVTYKS